VSVAAITLCDASHRVLIVIAITYFIMTQSGNFWIHPRKLSKIYFETPLNTVRCIVRRGSNRVYKFHTKVLFLKQSSKQAVARWECRIATDTEGQGR
jgi:hypothetical protein